MSRVYFSVFSNVAQFDLFPFVVGFTQHFAIHKWKLVTRVMTFTFFQNREILSMVNNIHGVSGFCVVT